MVSRQDCSRTTDLDGLLTSDYDFELPPDLIAQSPSERRDASRVMIVDRASGTVRHGHFGDITGLIPPGDVLVLNTTKVLRARLLGTRDSGAPAEVMLLRHVGDERWEALVHPGGKLRPGRRIRVPLPARVAGRVPDEAGEFLQVRIESVTDRRTRIVRLETPLPQLEAVERFGHVPLPPYIHRADEATDAERYQTVYARQPGSVAAPTAGLHFTGELLGILERKQVRRADVVLHVGAGTFKPVETEDPSQHVMHEEWCEISLRAASTINSARSEGRNVWAVGTTSVRTLESMADASGTVVPGSLETRIFIRPPYQWRVVDHLITNFHLPRSTLIMLVSAFAGYELTMEAYRKAIEERYRFFSYGDAMCII